MAAIAETSSGAVVHVESGAPSPSRDYVHVSRKFGQDELAPGTPKSAASPRSQGSDWVMVAPSVPPDKARESAARKGSDVSQSSDERVLGPLGASGAPRPDHTTAAAPTATQHAAAQSGTSAAQPSSPDVAAAASAGAGAGAGAGAPPSAEGVADNGMEARAPPTPLALSVDTTARLLDALMSSVADGERVTDAYELSGKRLGRGISSAVYAGKDKRTGQAVAIKATRFGSSDELTRALSEVYIMKKVAKLQNQALLPALAGFLDREERLVHIVTPLCAGGELFHRIYEHGRLSEHLAATILRKLVLGVSDLHRVGILHCDIKCENVLLKDPMDVTSVVLADFGISRCSEVPGVPLRGCGTPAYMAPELLGDRPQYSEKSDVWALGVILYVMLSGCHPFSRWREDTSRGTEDRIKSVSVSFEVDHFKGVGHAAKDLVMACLQKDPAARISVQDILRHDWLMQTQSAHSLVGFRNLKNFLRKHQFGHRLSAPAARKARARNEALTTRATTHGFHPDDVLRIQAALVARFPSSHSVTVLEFEAVMRELGYGNMPWQRLHELFEVRGSDTLDVTEFVHGLSAITSTTPADSMRLLFRVYGDASHDESLSPRMATQRRGRTSPEPDTSPTSTPKRPRASTDPAIARDDTASSTEIRRARALGVRALSTAGVGDGHPSRRSTAAKGNPRRSWPTRMSTFFKRVFRRRGQQPSSRQRGGAGLDTVDSGGAGAMQASAAAPLVGSSRHDSASAAKASAPRAAIEPSTTEDNPAPTLPAGSGHREAP